MGHLYRRGSVWWIQFYQDGQRVRMTSESTDLDLAKRMLREHEARVTLKEPVVARAARVVYDELRTDLVEHYQATGNRDLEEAGWRLKHLDRAFRGARASAITAAAITRYIVKRQGEQAANGTINGELAVLNRMLGGLRNRETPAAPDHSPTRGKLPRPTSSSASSTRPSGGISRMISTRP